MGNSTSFGEGLSSEEEEAVLELNCSLENLLDSYVKGGKAKNILVMAGAGISVSCGIPDFRSPGTGLYDNLQKYNLPTPQHVFDISYFKKTKGKAFYMLAKEMWPDNFNPSPAHAFIKLLNDKNLLLRCYTQNIDTLERAAGLPEDKVIEAHGSFATASCSRCKAEFDQNECRRLILANKTPIYCKGSSDPDCKGIVKPDIVFFGENLPGRFHANVKRDCANADLLIIMGTSLTVHPFASLVDMVPQDCPRLLLNMVPAGVRGPGTGMEGLRLRQSANYRDVMVEGACDDSVRAICDYLDWRKELEAEVNRIKSKSQNEKTILFDVAFPKMEPEGIAYNWRTGSLELPDIQSVEWIEEWSILETSGLELKVTSEKCTEVYVIGSSTTLQELKLEGLMCLSGDVKASWDEDDYLALVPKGLKVMKTETYASYVYLNEPSSYEVELPVDIHKFELEITGVDLVDEKEYELWHCSNEQGIVIGRYGPFRFAKPPSDNKL